jgi:hypothetical protein
MSNLAPWLCRHGHDKRRCGVTKKHHCYDCFLIANRKYKKRVFNTSSPNYAPLPSLKHWRLAKGFLTTDDLGRASGVQGGTIRSWERGDTRASLVNRKKVADGLGVSPGRLMMQPPKEIRRSA